MRRASRLVARALLSGGRQDSAAGLTAAPDAVPGALCHSVARHLMSGTLSQRPHSAAEAALSSNEQLGGAPPWDAPPTAPAAAQPVPGEHSGSSPHTSAPATVHAGEANGAGPKAAKGPHSQPGQQRLARQPRHSSSPRKQTPRLQQAQAGDQEQQQHQHRQRWPQQQRQHRQWQQPQKARPGSEPTHAPAAKKLWSLPRSKPENNPVAWQRHLVFGLLHNIETCREVLQLLQDHAARRQLSARELTVACSRMGKVFTALYKESGTMGGNADNNTTHCAGVFDIVAKNLSVLDTQGLATSIWMAARFHYMPPQEQRTAWETAVWERREEMSLIEISNVFFSLGVLHWDPRVEVMEALLDRALERQRELTPWMVCNMMWGCARLTSFHPGPKRMVQMLEALLPQLDAFKPESFCAVLFSLACLRCRPDDAALTALLDALEWRLKEANNRQLVTMVWALGALQLGELVTERLWSGIDARLLMQEEQLNFSSAPFYFFGAARLQMAPSGELLQMLLSKAVALRSELRTGDVSVILWGLAKLGHVSGEGPVSKRFVQTMIERFMEHDVEAPATLRQLSSFLWSLALLAHPPPQKVLDRCISAADSQATQSQGGLSSTDASMLLSAFETFGSAEGLALLQRHIIGTGEDEVSADVDLTDELRPDVQL